MNNSVVNNGKIGSFKGIGFSINDSGVITAIDLETLKTLWSVPVSKNEHDRTNVSIFIVDEITESVFGLTRDHISQINIKTGDKTWSEHHGIFHLNDPYLALHKDTIVIVAGGNAVSYYRQGKKMGKEIKRVNDGLR